MQELLLAVARGLVEDKDAVKVTVDEPREDGTIVYHLSVAEGDMGRVIGKQGRIAKAIRVVMRAAAVRVDEKVPLLRSTEHPYWPFALAARGLFGYRKPSQALRASSPERGSLEQTVHRSILNKQAIHHLFVKKLPPRGSWQCRRH